MTQILTDAGTREGENVGRRCQVVLANSKLFDRQLCWENFAEVAQLAEQVFCNDQVASSTIALSSLSRRRRGQSQTRYGHDALNV